MMKSVRSLLKTMTPTPRRQKPKDQQAGTPDTDVESPEPPAAPSPPPPPLMDICHLYRLLDTQIRVNIGTSVKCGICLSTLQTPTRTPCGHAFCKPCILASLRATAKCPECNTKITKRALQPAHEQLQKLAMLYKQSLVEFGFAPGTYQAGFTTLTQKPPSDPDDSDEDDSDEDNEKPEGDKGSGDNDNDKKQLALDRLHVAATWQHHAVPTTKIQKEENTLVVQANTKACEAAGWVIGGQPPTTQDILDQAREQQVADTALEEDSSFQQPDQSSPPRATGRRVSFEPVTTRQKRAIPKTPSPAKSPFRLASSLSPIAQEGSQRSNTEAIEDSKPAAATFTAEPPAAVGLASSMSPTPNPTNLTTKIVATCEPSKVQSPTGSIMKSKSNNQEPTSTSKSPASLESKSQDKKANTASGSLLMATSSPTTTTRPSPKAAEVSGIVEDSYGALHWTNKSNISLTLSPWDEPEVSTLSPMVNQQEEPVSLVQEDQQGEGNQGDMELGHLPLDSNNPAEDSDATVPMTCDDTMSDAAVEPEDDQKPPARRRAHSEPSFAISTVATFTVGDIVNVQSRTWSGINKPGGVARITRINPDHTYNVAYVLGGKESNVDAVFVTATENTDKRRRRETTLPVSLLQALEAQGFDTTGQLTLEPARIVPKKEKEHSSSRKQSRKSILQDLSNQPVDAQEHDEDVKPPTKKAKVSTISSRRVKNSPSNFTTEEVPDGKATKKRNRSSITQAKSSTDRLGYKKQSSKRNKADQDESDTLSNVNEVGAMSTEEGGSTTPKPPLVRNHKSEPTAKGDRSSDKNPRTSTAVSVLETLNGADTGTNDDICTLADAHYQARFQASLQEKVIHIVASGLSEVDMDILKALTSKSLGNNVRVKVSDRITNKTTLCITPCEAYVQKDDSITVLRTVKVMRASLAGIPIVSPSWLYECGQEGPPPSLSPHFVARSLPTKVDLASFCQDSKHGVARMAVLMAQKAPLPLENHFTFFCGAFEANHRKDLQLLAREAGAKVLTNTSAVMKKLGKAKVILVCHDIPTTGAMIPPSLLEAVRKSLATHSKNNTLVVNSQWIFESVTCAKAMPPDAFAPANVKARELWQLGQES